MLEGDSFMATYVISDIHGQYNMFIEQVFLIMQKK